MKVLIIDNYDSFTYNLVHLIECFTDDYEVWRNDAIDMLKVADFDAILLSPGPGLPNEAGLMTELIKQYISTKPILGICLGCQALGEYFGAELYNMKAVKHGLQTPIKIIDHKNLYEGLPNTIAVGRYHSWALKLKDDSNLIPTAYDEQNTLMSFRHRDLAVYGIQYHPESIMSPDGMKLIENWMNSIKG